MTLDESQRAKELAELEERLELGRKHHEELMAQMKARVQEFEERQAELERAIAERKSAK